MALTIYGSRRSRTMRVLWAAAELGLDYDHLPLAHDDPGLKHSAFLAINPAGTLPAIVDDGFALSESLAINLYLAKKHASTGSVPLYPTTLEGEAVVWRWTLWAQAHLEPWVALDAVSVAARQGAGEAVHAAVRRALAILEGALAGRMWLVGEMFTIADLNVACVLSPTRAAQLDFGPYDHVREWLARCYGRPAAIAARRRHP